MGFESYVRTFPTSPEAPEAQLRAGNSYLQTGKNDKAVEAYDVVIRTYAKSSSVPEAYAKKGVALMNLKQYDRAREALEYVVKNYPPDNAAVGLAQQRLPDAALQRRLNVAEHQVGLLPVVGRQLRVEVGEDVQFRCEGLAIVHVVAVDPSPEEGLAWNALQTFQSDAPGFQEVEILLSEVFADDTDDVGFRKVAGGQGDVSAGAAQGAFYFARRSGESVISDGADNNK